MEKNLLKLLSGKAAKIFIGELTSWLEHLNRDSEYKSIALKVYMILPPLHLQKRTCNGKAKDHTKKLEERLSTWNEDKIMEMTKEGRIVFRSTLHHPVNEYPKIMPKSSQTWWCKGEQVQSWKFWLLIHV